MEDGSKRSPLKIAGITRVKNGGRWIEEWAAAMLHVCDQVLVLDNRSTDDTVEILESFAPRVQVMFNPSRALNEAGDKNVLVAALRERMNPDWCVFLDADEILLDGEALLKNIHSASAPAYSVHIWSCWNDPEHVRQDGIYGRCWRASCFNMRETNGRWEERSPDGPNLHCNNIPGDLQSHVQRCNPEVRIKHYGYMLREDRIRKYHWYINIDPMGLYLAGEDYYRHSVQGDLPEFPAQARYMHGGPLNIIPFPRQATGLRWVGNQQVPVYA